MNEQELVQHADDDKPWCSVEVGMDAKATQVRVKSVKLRFDAETDISQLRKKAVEAVRAAAVAADWRGLAGPDEQEQEPATNP